MLLEQLTGELQATDFEHDYLSVLDQDNVLGWLMTIAGFANYLGGTLFVGVDEGSHKLIGFEREEAHSQRELFNSMADEHLTPRPFCKTSILRFEEKGSARFILRIDVTQCPARPVIVDYKGLPFVFMRRENYTGGATYEEIISMSISSMHAAYDTLPSEESYKRDQFRSLLHFSARHADGEELSDETLSSIGFFDENQFLKNGSVLFGDAYSGTKTALKCTLYSGLTKESDRIVTINSFNGNIPNAIEYACSFVLQRMNHSIIRKNSSHVEIDAYPRQALQEAVVQAFARRNYFLDKALITIDMFRDRLEISCPGSFSQDGPAISTYDIADVASRQRNSLICSILASCHVIDPSETGYPETLRAYQKAEADDLHRPYLRDYSDHFTLVLPDLTYATGVADSRIPAVEFAPLQHGSEYDEQILSYCCNMPRKTAEIAKYLGISDSTYLRKGILGNLVENEYLKAEKANRATYYRTNFELVRVI